MRTYFSFLVSLTLRSALFLQCRFLLTGALSKLGITDDMSDSSTALALFRSADMDDDGQISFEEMRALATQVALRMTSHVISAPLPRKRVPRADRRTRPGFSCQGIRHF